MHNNIRENNIALEYSHNWIIRNGNMLLFALFLLFILLIWVIKFPDITNGIIAKIGVDSLNQTIVVIKVNNESDKIKYIEKNQKVIFKTKSWDMKSLAWEAAIKKNVIEGQNHYIAISIKSVQKSDTLNYPLFQNVQIIIMKRLFHAIKEKIL